MNSHEAKAREIADNHLEEYLVPNGLNYQALKVDISQALQTARREGMEAAIHIADERARILNVLGSDAKMTRKLTHAEIQAERVFEAQEISSLIRIQIQAEESAK